MRWPTVLGRAMRTTFREDCDLPDRPCRWFIYKDTTKPRAIHYERQGFTPPADAP